MSQLPDSRSMDWREERRMQAWSLHEQGWTQPQIAQELVVSQGTVSRWFKQVREQGSLEALRRHPAPGKRALLTEEQFTQIPELMKRGAEAFGFQGSHWTTRRAAVALQQVFGVAYHPGHVSRLLKKHYPDWRKV